MCKFALLALITKWNIWLSFMVRETDPRENPMVVEGPGGFEHGRVGE